MNNQCIMLGKNYNRYGKISYCNIDKNIACAISIGADKNSPSLMYKGDTKFANEDAVLAMRQDDHVILAVADSHFGQWASHSIISGLTEYAHQISDLASVYNIFQVLCEQYSDKSEHSETTLIIISLNLNTGDGFGISYGDSSALIVSQLGIKQINSKNQVYISLNNIMDLSEGIANEFTFTLVQGECLAIFTDGIDECHYGNPVTSINNKNILDLFHKHNTDIKMFSSQLALLALAGVDGNPGGQDNIAIAAILF